MQHQNPNGIHNVLTIIADVSKQSSHCSSVPSSDQSSLVQSVELASSPIFCVCRNRLFISWTRRSSFVSHFKGKYINHSVIQQQGVKKKQSYFFKWSRTESESWTQLDSWYVDLLYKKKRKKSTTQSLLSNVLLANSFSKSTKQKVTSSGLDFKAEAWTQICSQLIFLDLCRGCCKFWRTTLVLNCRPCLFR